MFNEKLSIIISSIIVFTASTILIFSYAATDGAEVGMNNRVPELSVLSMNAQKMNR